MRQKLKLRRRARRVGQCHTEGKTAQHFLESMTLVGEEGIRRTAPQGLTLVRELGKERRSLGRVRSHHNGLKVTHTKSLDSTFNSACARHGGTCL